MRVSAALLLVAVTAWPLRADTGSSSERPPLLRDVGLEPRLGATVPLDLEFRDENGERVRLARYFGERPVVLSLVYFGCPMLCGQVLGGLTTALRDVPLEPGRDFTLLTVSFDPHDDPEAARRRKTEVVGRYGRPDAEHAWHFLTGDEDAIRRLTDAVGFRYAWDEVGSQFAHVALVTILTPDGRVSRYLQGIEYPPRDVRLGVVEASRRNIASTVDRILLFCYRYDSATGRYTLAIERALKIGGLMTLLGLGALVGVLAWRERRTA